MSMDHFTYETAVKNAQLVERNPHTTGVDLLDSSRVSMHEEKDIIELALQIKNADKQLKSSTCQKLCLILDQIKMLQAQAMDILTETEKHQSLHTAACNFIKKPGQIYHLYEKITGQYYFSMLSPQEWNGAIDQKFVGSYRLEYDSTWTPLENVKQRDEKMNWAENCLDKATKNDNVLAIGSNIFENCE